jgi:hypothetical protein
LTVLCYLLALALIVAGVGGVILPQALSGLYGMRVSDGSSQAYVRATAIRDIGIGAALAVAVYAHVLVLLVTLTAIGVAISFADFTILLHARKGRIGVAHAGHAAGAIAFIVALGMVLFAIGR